MGKHTDNDLNEKMTQIRLVREALLAGMALTPIDAYKLCGTIRLGAIIHTLRHNEDMPIKNLNPKGKYAIYTL